MALTKIGKEGITGISNSANATAITISADEEVTMPLQPSFLVKPTSAQNNVGINDGSAVVITFDNEIYDIGANFASNAFTAPVTGKYYLSAQLYMLHVDSAATYIGMYIYTSNRFYFQLIDPDFGQDATYWTFTQSVVADMDANDTVNIRFAQYQGTIQTDIQTGSMFMGHLLG